MKRFILAAALFASVAATAEASCNKSNLNGSWVVYQISGSTGPAISIVNSQFVFGGITFKISTFGSNCRGTGTATSGTSISSLLAASENIKSTSSAKPNMLELSMVQGPVVTSYLLFRR